jgi:excisionase family DNA binding protein
MTVDDPVFLTVQEVAGLLRVSVMTVHRLIRAKTLPATRVGKVFRVRDADLREYIDGQSGGFAAGSGEREACGLLLKQAQEAIAFERERAEAAETLLAHVRELAESWTQIDDGQGPPTKEMLLEAGCGRAVLDLLNGGHPLNGPHPAVWSGACLPGGMVCAVPNPSLPDGICGNPVESEPCRLHEEESGGS